ncbi:MAG: phenylacetate--CoA ligase family protein [Deltaproteobacteria bacterium]|nr:phenylacetate--CoA ligase family protein [Deltaproteobacteria bacterium]
MISPHEGRRPYWNMEIETKLNTPEMKAIQWAKVTKKVEYLYETAPYWRGRMKSVGVKPADLKTWDDYYKRIPVFTKEDHRQYAEECGGDLNALLRGFMGEEAERLTWISATSGTTGDPSPYPFTKRDREVWTEFTSRQLWRGGVYPGDKVLHGFGLSMFMGGAILCLAVSDYGACCIPVGAEAGTEALLKYAKLLKPKALVCTPSLAEYMIEKAVEITGKSVAELGIRRLLCGGEPGAGIPELRRKLETAFDAEVYDLAFGGCSCEHPEYQGMHYLNEDVVLYELVDPVTHEHVPMEDGATGIGVLTQLDGTVTLAGLRQTPNDINQVFTSPCPCGKTGLRFRIVGRADDMLKVKGVMVYPAALSGVINSFVPRVTGEFRIVLDEPPPRVVPPLRLKVEYGEGVAQEQLAALAEEIAEAMHQRTKVRPAITWVAPNTLERFLKKKNLFEKTYEAP